MKICTECHTEHHDDAKFCGNCGAKFLTPTAAPGQLKPAPHPPAGAVLIGCPGKWVAKPTFSARRKSGDYKEESVTPAQIITRLDERCHFLAKPQQQSHCDELSRLVNVPSLITLSLVNDYPYGDAFLKTLMDFGYLENLHIPFGYGVTNEGLGYIATLKSLKMLILGAGCNINDSGLMLLKELKTLTSLSIDGTAITRGGVAAFRQAMPQCQVDKD